MTGLDWWDGFRQRQRSLLSIREPEALSLSRAQCMDQPAVNKYFDILDKEAWSHRQAGMCLQL